jgi:hypothetical protein
MLGYNHLGISGLADFFEWLLSCWNASCCCSSSFFMFIDGGQNSVAFALSQKKNESEVYAMIVRYEGFICCWHEAGNARVGTSKGKY